VPLDSASVPFETLLRHQQFVRRLARSLVRDEDAAGDVEQETWLAALSHEPRSVDSVRAWLASIVRNRAHNQRREATRRTAREQSSARSEVDASDEQLRDQVEIAQDVVRAVLSLREPYRATVLSRYYENLSPREIAARRHVPSSTVRAQLTRAHQMLRSTLDVRNGGDRRAWSAALSTLTAKTSAGVSALKLFAISTACIGAVAFPVWLLAARSSKSANVAWYQDINGNAFRADDEEVRMEAEPTSAVTRELAAEQATQQPEAVDPQLAAKSVRELLEVAVQTQRTIRMKLLTPDERIVREQANLLRLPSTGLARLLERGKFGTDEFNALGIRGGGSSYSFATHGQSWGDEPDLALEKGTLRLQGGQSTLLELGDLRLEDLPDAAGAVPSGLDDAKRAAWSILWTDAHSSERAIDPAFEEQRRRLPQQGTPRVGRTYLLRALQYHVHDLLVAFTPLHQDDTGCTIAWRVLQVWATSNRPTGRDDRYWWVADPPASITALDVDSLVGSLARIRAAARAKLFDPPTDPMTRYATVLALPHTGIARLLVEQRYNALVGGWGGSSSFTFTTASNEGLGDLALNDNGYSVPYGIISGFLLDVGELAISSLTEPLDLPCGNLAPPDQDRWRFLVDAPAPQKGQGFSRNDQGQAQKLEFASLVRPEVGRTCLVRSVRSEDHDVLVAFTTVAVDDAGTWIVWRVLRDSSLSRPSKPR
jgi:RNA polymerase sigma factor (sigma-70 family)